jgi:hypothetical protein
MDDSDTSKTGPTLNKNIRIKPSMLIDILNAIENSKNIECISYSSLYGFVFRVKLEKQNSKKFNINTSHNNIKIFKPARGYVSIDEKFNPTHIVLKFTVLVDKDNVRLNDCVDVYSGEKYIKYTNTVSDFNNEVSYQKSIYHETKGENNIAICPRIFQNYNFENRDAIEFLEFFDKNISDNVCTYVVKYLLGIFHHDTTKKLGFIAMEYVKLGDEGESGKIRDTRITLYKFLTYQGSVQPSGNTKKIVDRLIEILPILKKDPMFLYNYQHFTTNSQGKTNRSKQTTFMNYDNIKEHINANTTTDRTEIEQLEYLKLNYYKYRILAHVIYYMMRAYQVGYIHNDLHSNNIFVVNPYLTTKGGSIYNGCLHPFSLNDVGIGELDQPTRKYQEYLFTNIKDIKSETTCTSIQNYCNFSCIQIIDWGRTTPSETTPSETTHSETAENSVIDILDVLKTINILKKKYTKYSYIFYIVGLNSDIQNLKDLQFPQFYVIWLIWNEYEKKVKAAEQAKNKAKENIDNLKEQKTNLENVESRTEKTRIQNEENIKELQTNITNAEEEFKNAEEKLENAKNVFKQSTKVKTVVNENDPNNEKIKKKFYEFLILFKTNCEFNTFYETLEYNVNPQLVKKK